MTQPKRPATARTPSPQQQRDVVDYPSVVKSSPSPSLLWMAYAFFSMVFVTCVRSALAFGGPEPALAFYGVYHRHPWNQAIHFVGVPMIIWTLLIMAAHVPLFPMMGQKQEKSLLTSLRVHCGGWVQPHPPTWATMMALLYVVFYLRIDVVGALLYTPILMGMYKTAVEWTARCRSRNGGIGKDGPNFSTSRLLTWAMIVHVLGWYVQIHPGHRIIEGAQPAAVANLGAALTTGPLFAFYEGVWYLGFRKQLQRRVLDLVQVYTQQLCEEGSAMRVCATLKY
jgi:2-hydroxy fatty acid dioxygenase